MRSKNELVDFDHGIYREIIGIFDFFATFFLEKSNCQQIWSKAKIKMLLIIYIFYITVI